jgi:hypothetical protein
MNKTTQVPTEWLEELRSYNEVILKQSMPIGNCAYNYDLLRLTSHIKASKYFQQPEPESLDVDLEEFAKWICDSPFAYYVNESQHKWIHIDKETVHTFSEVLQSFKKSKG